MEKNRQFVSFYVDEQLYGIDIRLIKEVNPNINVISVPRSSNNIRGLVNIRGQVVLVMDVALVLGFDICKQTKNTHIVILKTRWELEHLKIKDDYLDYKKFGDKPVGLMAESIAEVLTIDKDNIEQAPLHISEDERKYYEGVIDLGKELMIILNVGEIIKF